jgi:hypothetical protein
MRAGVLVVASAKEPSVVLSRASVRASAEALARYAAPPSTANAPSIRCSERGNGM